MTDDDLTVAAEVAFTGGEPDAGVLVGDDGTVHVVGSPKGGFFRLNHRHAISEQIPWNYSSLQIQEKTNEMMDLDAAITAQHAADPKAFKDCEVCNPVPSFAFSPSGITWREKLRCRWRMIKWAITADVDDDFYSEF